MTFWMGFTLGGVVVSLLMGTGVVVWAVRVGDELVGSQ